MTASTPHRIAVLLVATLAIAACKREQPAPEATPVSPPQAAAPATETAPTEAATIPGTDAIAAVENASAEAGVQPAAGIDAKAFAGVFVAEGARIEFKADGRYAMTVHAASADADLESTGTWSTDAGDRHVLLDPDDKSEADRRYQRVSPDELKAVEGGQVLRREGAR